MKIVLVNKFYYPKDGVTNYLLEIEAKLKEFGHEVRIFAMDNPKNLETPDKKYFVSYISFDGKGLFNAWRALMRIFYSLEAKRKFQALIKDFKPDLVHIHNLYHQISPSILSVTKKNKIPVVMHLHDYKLVCPNYKLFIRGNICHQCQGGRYYHCFANKCLKNSKIKSLGGALEMYFHHLIWPIYRTGVNLFIAPSIFMKQTCLDFGWPENKIKYLNNFYTGEISPANQETSDYLLYFGRLAEEKGVALLLNALNKQTEKLLIAGEGPATDKLKGLATKLGLNERVKFLGFKTGSELQALIAKAKAVIIPSIWLENMPLNMLEAMAAGKIVIAARIGGLPEIIEDGQNGLLFRPGDIDDLNKKIKELESIDKEKLSRAAQETVKNLDADNHVRELIQIYHSLL